MVAIVCALVLSSTNLNLGIVAQVASARELYHHAANSIVEKDFDAAINSLALIVSNHENSELSEVAAFHLAECYLHQGRSLDALATLSRWYGRIEASSSIEQLAPGIKSRTAALLEKVLPLLTIDDFASAQAWLEQAAETTTDGLLKQRLLSKLRFEMPLASAEHMLETGNSRAAISLLKAALESSPESDQVLSLRFLLAEAYFAEGDRAAATQEFEWLTEQGSRLPKSPAWLAAVKLRRAELLVRSRAFAQARQLLVDAKQQHADFEFAFEFDYLLARCAIARIEFDEAASHLRQVISSPSAANNEPAARATWMLGEVYFLQRQYAPAIEAYYQVVRMDAFPQWQARALLQAAKCHEHEGKPTEALADYKRAAAIANSPQVCREATARIASLETTPNDLR